VAPASDADLLLAWRAGDRRAGEALATRHYPAVLRYFELNASSAAEDLAQHAFTACLEGRDKLRDAGAFRPYLMSIARRQLALYHRKASRTRLLHRFNIPGRRTQLSTLVARNREQLALLRALASMPRQPQLLLVLFYWDGVSTTELAQSWDVTPSTIRSRLARAREQLRQRMEALTSTEPAEGDDQRLGELITSVCVESGSLSTKAPTQAATNE